MKKKSLIVNHKKKSTVKERSKSMINEESGLNEIDKIKNNFLAYLDSTELARKNSLPKEEKIKINNTENWAQILVRKEMEFEDVVQKLNIKTFLVK
jgi:hypothetical protein